MPEGATYLSPTEEVEIEQEIKRSRFITWLGPARSREDALALLSRAREVFPDATHHCWAYVVGDPARTSTVGMSDDGEPQGTAGKPMLSLLQQRGIGDVVAIVTRYFGGTKLGTGGLLRAYTSSLQQALELATLSPFVPSTTIRISCPFRHESAIRRLLQDFDLDVDEVRYSTTVEIVVATPEHHLEALRRAAIDQTSGAATIAPEETRA